MDNVHDAILRVTARGIDNDVALLDLCKALAEQLSEMANLVEKLRHDTVVQRVMINDCIKNNMMQENRLDALLSAFYTHCQRTSETIN